MEAFNPVKSDPTPTNFPPVIIPVAIIFPVELIPTPSVNVARLFVPPTWNKNLGSLVPTPTKPCEYMLVNPRPTSMSNH